MDNYQLEGISLALTAALTEFLKGKDFYTELISFTLAKPEKKKASSAQGEHQMVQSSLNCHFNDDGQYVCTKPH